MPISGGVRVTTVILVSILACGAPPPLPEADPIGGGGPRPSLRGNRLIAPLSAARLEVAVTSPVAPGGTATATVVGVAGSRCTIEVTYRSGTSEAQGLDPARAGEDGAVSWNWIVGINTTPGDWVVAVGCVAPDGSRARGHGRLTVREAGAAPTGSAEAGR